MNTPAHNFDSPGNREALLLWHRVMLEGVRSGAYDLSARQISVLLTLYLESESRSVRQLATALNISKPAICRALDALEKLELISRSKDPDDRRNVIIARTEKGHAFLSAFSESILNQLMAIQ